MFQFIFHRGIKAIITMFAVVTVVFLFTRITGNPFDRELADEGLTAEMRNELEKYYGLDDSLSVQYVRYIKGLFRGYAGRSVAWEGELVTNIYKVAFPKTAKLIIWCIPLGLLAGIPLGIIGAIKKNKITGQAAMIFAFVGYAMPNFIVALLLIYIFGFRLGWLPTMGDATPAHYILPVISLSMAKMATNARYTRSAMLDVLSQDYIRTARGKGLKERVVIYKHAFRNALIPVLTVLGVQIAVLLTGSIVIETMFSWPGFGFTLVNAIKERDYAVVQFGVLIVALLIITFNLIVDVLYSLADPRIRVQG